MPAGLSDPISMAAAATSSGLQSLGGLFQVLFSGRKKAERRLQTAVDSSPAYAGNKPVSDYYNEAYNRYLTSPQNSAMYQNAMQGINRNTANALNFLQDRRGALDAVGQVQAAQNQGLNNALLNAEQQRNQRFGLLGEAAQMKGADDMQKFQINTMMPYQRKLGLLTTKAANANQTFNTGLQNIFHGISNGAQLAGGSGMDFGQNAQQLPPMMQPSNQFYAPQTYGE